MTVINFINLNNLIVVQIYRGAVKPMWSYTSDIIGYNNLNLKGVT